MGQRVQATGTALGISSVAVRANGIRERNALRSVVAREERLRDLVRKRARLAIGLETVNEEA